MAKYIKVYLSEDEYDREYVHYYWEKNHEALEEWEWQAGIVGFTDAIKNEKPIILTTLTHAINSHYYEMGYDIVVVYGDKEMKFTDVLNGVGNWTERDVRMAHNWEKMLLNGEFKIWGDSDKS